MPSIFDSSQGLFWLTWTKCPPRQNQWFQPFFEGDSLSFKGRSLTGAAHQFELRIQNPGHRLLLKILLLTKWRSRPNQWFQHSKLLIDEIDKGNINSANDFWSALGLTGRSVYRFTHQLRRFAQDCGQRFSPRFFTTHNLLVKNEFESPSSEVRHLKKKLMLVRQVWGNIWRKSGDVSRGRSPGLRQSPSSFEPVKIALKRALRQRAFQGGVIGRENLVTGCITPPWNDLKPSDIFFINPLRYAPIADATMGLIQAMIFHSGVKNVFS